MQRCRCRLALAPRHGNAAHARLPAQSVPRTHCVAMTFAICSAMRTGVAGAVAISCLVASKISSWRLTRASRSRSSARSRRLMPIDSSRSTRRSSVAATNARRCGSDELAPAMPSKVPPARRQLACGGMLDLEELRAEGLRPEREDPVNTVGGCKRAQSRRGAGRPPHGAWPASG